MGGHQSNPSNALYLRWYWFVSHPNLMLMFILPQSINIEYWALCIQRAFIYHYIWWAMTNHYGWPIIAINLWPIRWRRPMRSNHFLFADLLKPLLLLGCKFTRAHPFSRQCDTILSSKIWHTNHLLLPLGMLYEQSTSS